MSKLLIFFIDSKFLGQSNYLDSIIQIPAEINWLKMKIRFFFSVSPIFP